MKIKYGKFQFTYTLRLDIDLKTILLHPFLVIKHWRTNVKVLKNIKGKLPRSCTTDLIAEVNKLLENESQEIDIDYDLTGVTYGKMFDQDQERGKNL